MSSTVETKQISRMACRKLISFCVPFACLALILIVSYGSFSEARYLPTRADKSSIEALKEIIKNILNEASGEYREREAIDRQQQARQQQMFNRSARFFSNRNNRARQLLARKLGAYLTAENDNINGPDRMPLNAALMEHRTAEMVANEASVPALTDFSAGLQVQGTKRPSNKMDN